MNRLGLAFVGAALAVTLGACSGDDTSSATDSATGSTGSTGSSSGSSSESSTSGTTGAATETSTSGADTAADGDPCVANADCASLSCLKYTDNDANAACSAAPEGGNTRITGTVFDFVSGATVADAELKVVGALAALQNPNDATPIVTATSMADGRLDVTSTEPISAGIGIVGTIGGSGLYLAATGLASPVMGSSYGPLNSIHDVWAMPQATLDAWNGLLAADPDLAAYLPLGDKGGVVGKVRNKNTGAGIAAATVVPVTEPSNALIRYLNEAGDGFVSDATSSSGIFVLVAPGLAEEFTVEIGGSVVAETTGKAGSASTGAVFIMILGVDQ